MATVGETAVLELVEIKHFAKDLLDVSFRQALCQGHRRLLLPSLDLLLDLTAFFGKLAIKLHVLGQQLLLLLLLALASGAARCL